MRVEPARVDQIRRGTSGRMVHIPADVGGVAEELRRIHPGLKVRYAENGDPPFFAVYYESQDQRNTYLILTAQQLDHRVVKRIQEIDRDGRSGYDYAKALEDGTLAARERAIQEFRDRVSLYAEEAAHAVRKDLGSKRRAFIPRAV